MAEEEKLTCQYIYTVYEKDDYFVNKYKDVLNNRIVIACGNLLPCYPRVLVNLNGEWGKNKHGDSFYVKSYDFNVTNEKESICLYLSCGLFPYIGIRTAEKIYSLFGDDTLQILDKDIDRLKEVKGLTAKKVEKIKKVYECERTKKDLVSFLLPFGIPLKVILKVDKAYDDMTISDNIIEKIKLFPYRLIDVSGISLKTIDAIAKKVEACCHDYTCFRAYAIDLLNANETKGNTCLALSEFCSMLLRALEKYAFSSDDILKYTKQMIQEEELLCQEKNGYKYVGKYLRIKQEYEIARSISSLIKNKTMPYKEADVYKTVDEVCNKKGVVLDSIQKTAVLNALMHRFSIITGGGGTGKTTITKIIADSYELLTKGKNEVVLIAPTGRASRRLSDLTNRTASTYHSRLRLGFGEDNLVSDYLEDVTLEDSLIIGDETSMVATKEAYELFSHVTPSCIIVLVGDIDQLPSVGCGSVLRDLIMSEAITCTYLDCVYRQQDGSHININARKIKKGMTDIEEGEDFHIVECSKEEVEDLMLEKTIEMREKYGSENVMCLCPYKENLPASVKSMNNKIQNAVNPLSNAGLSHMEKNGYDFRVGDMVMQTLKNREECSNGDIGVIEEIVKTTDDSLIHVNFTQNKTFFEYEDEDISELTLAYASTIHKAQGSESDAVVTCLLDYHAFMCKRNFLYTDVSRAKKEIWIYGNKSAIEKAILTEDTYCRNTMLETYIRMLLHNEKKERYEQLSFV